MNYTFMSSNTNLKYYNIHIDTPNLNILNLYYYYSRTIFSIPKKTLSNTK